MGEAERVVPLHEDMMELLGRWIDEKRWFVGNCPTHMKEQVEHSLAVYEGMRKSFQAIIDNGGLRDRGVKLE